MQIILKTLLFYLKIREKLCPSKAAKNANFVKWTKKIPEVFLIDICLVSPQFPHLKKCHIGTQLKLN
jgi:hypothetical protein